MKVEGGRMLESREELRQTLGDRKELPDDRESTDEVVRETAKD